MENRAEQLIESYFSNELSGPDAAELSRLAATDPRVAEELAFQRRVSQTLQKRSLTGGIQNAAWREAAQQPLFPVTHSAIRVSMIPRYAYAMAAALALLVAAYVFMRPPSLETTLAENTTDYPNKMKFRSLGSEAETVSPDVINAFGLYDKKDFGAAAKALAPIVAAQPERMDYRFYWGVSLVKNGQYLEARKALETVAQSQDEKRIVARYYLGIACAGAGDTASACENLNAYIASDNDTYAGEARTVAEKIKCK